MKDQRQVDKQEVASLWHVPDKRELLFVDEILNAHLKKPLACLKEIATRGKEGYKSKSAG
jgi:hypothetical protein